MSYVPGYRCIPNTLPAGRNGRFPAALREKLLNLTDSEGYVKGESNAMPESNNQNSPATMSALVSTLRPEVASVLDRALGGKDISVSDGEVLFETHGPEFTALMMVADELRRRAVGDLVTYVVNRNINFTNVCIKRCGFCAFSRDFRQEEGYFLPVNEIIRRAKEAQQYGATEVCVQAGLPPQMEGDLYIKLCEAIKEELPDMHVHGFSPEEVLYGSIRSKCSIRDYLQGLKDAGVGSLPGTSAECWIRICATSFRRVASRLTNGSRL